MEPKPITEEKEQKNKTAAQKKCKLKDKIILRSIGRAGRGVAAAPAALLFEC